MGLLVFQPFRTEPPLPSITAGDTHISTTQGYYCWSGILSTACANPVRPLDSPTSVSPGEEINIEFRMKPFAESLKVEQGKNNVTQIPIHNHIFVAPKEKGLYLFNLTAFWNNGDGNYAFSIIVE
ncbi:hypothetical protein [Psychrobacillus sp. BL-248-WT-3]|uniref:hypothetical protein n=1 Tax=Psychrobacillus sp. BL-248-WT-3 TaxID=2725306 RepID=UPI00146A228A|nr:hypothetical protein [Psychrobacillus sp. BL-248-WT-3]NME07556.1 hypothetical protein [Psychrobacillus sp. BL-248-WT-3]